MFLQQQTLLAILVIFLASFFSSVWSKQFRKCDFLNELTKYNVDLESSAKFTCIAGYNSKLRTSLVEGDKYGIFGFTLNQCTQQCGVASCDAFLNNEISDDVRCALKIHENSYGSRFESWSKYKEKNCDKKWKQYLQDCNGQGSEGSQNAAMKVFGTADFGDITMNPCGYVRAIKGNFKLSKDDFSAWACVSFDYLSCTNSKSAKCRINCDSIKTYGNQPNAECGMISEGISGALSKSKGRVFIPKLQLSDCKNDLFGILSVLCPEVLNYKWN